MALENRRAYLRAIPGMTIETQRWMAQDNKTTVVFEGGIGRNGVPRLDTYISSLRAGDEAWVPRLDVLVRPKEERRGRSAAATLGSSIADILGRGAIIVDGETGITSRDGDRWKERVELTMRRITSGRMTRAKARKIGAKGGAVIRGRAATTRWKAPAMKAEFARWASVWRDPIYSNDQAASDAIEPPELNGRPHLCRRLFGPRRPGDKRAGGRPRKRSR
jgi:hypothetical protein